jgi:flagellar basal-body rod modification protein FlgD
MTLNSVTSAAAAVDPFDTSSTGGSNSSTSSSGSSSSTTSSSDTPQVTQNQFLQLLVTQLQNQDPLDPTNSDQFMSELAQFSQLQEVMGIHQDFNALLQANNIAIPSGS